MENSLFANADDERKEQPVHTFQNIHVLMLCPYVPDDNLT